MPTYWTTKGLFRGENFKIEWGRVHRVDAPAIITESGTTFWFLNGSQHRIDGPAVEVTNGKKYWYINNNRCTLEEFVKKTPYLTSDAERLSFYLRWK